MAFNTRELTFVDLSGFTPNLSLLIGRYTNTGGSTGGDIIPGNPSTGDAAGNSVGMRTIVGNGWYTSEALPTTSSFGAITNYDTSFDRNVVTLTTTADDVGIYYVLGYQNGA